MDNRAMRLWVGGPLATYAAGFRAVLAEQGYAPSSVSGQLQLMAQLSDWLATRGMGGSDLGPVVAEGFMESRRASGYRQRGSAKRLSPLLVYLRRLGVAPTLAPVPPTAGMGPGLIAYRTYLITERGLAAATVRNYVHVAGRFLTDLGFTEGRDLAALTAAEVSEFVVAHCRDNGAGSVTQVVVGMRSLLRYLHLAGITPVGLAAAVPSAAARPARSLPQPIDHRQKIRLLRCSDRRTPVGRRDFAVLTLMVRLGLRAGEVAALELSDIDWRHGDLLVRGKGHREERLPLPTDVGEAIAGWLRRGRPQCSCVRVFTTLLAPRGPLTRHAVTAIVRRAAHRSGVVVTAHRLRHTAGTDLLRAGASLPEVSQVLRHTSLLSTAIYAKVDHSALAEVLRPWPTGGAR